MKKIVVILAVFVAAASLALAACSGSSASEPEEDPAEQFVQYEGMSVTDTYYALEGSGWEARYIDTDFAIEEYQDATEALEADIHAAEENPDEAYVWLHLPDRYKIKSVMDVDYDAHVVTFEVWYLDY